MSNANEHTGNQQPQATPRKTRKIKHVNGKESAPAADGTNGTHQPPEPAKLDGIQTEAKPAKRPRSARKPPGGTEGASTPEKRPGGPENGLPAGVAAEQHQFLSTLFAGVVKGTFLMVAQKRLDETGTRDVFPARSWNPGKKVLLTGPWYVCCGASADYRHRKNETIRRLRFLVIDDVGTKVERSRIAAAPTWDLETSPGNHQLGFMFSGWLDDLAGHDALNDALVDAKLQDPGAKGIARLSRVPGSLNDKPTAGGWTAQLRLWEPTTTYESIDALAAALGVTPGEREARKPRKEHTEAAGENAMQDWLADQGMLGGATGGGFVDMECPFSDEHGRGREGDGARFKPLPGNGCVVECWHSHGQEDKAAYRVRFLNWVLAEGGPTVSTTKPCISLSPKMLLALQRQRSAAAGGEPGGGQEHETEQAAPGDVATAAGAAVSELPEWDFANRSDAGNCAHLKLLTGGGMRYVPELKLWIFWTGSQWVRDEHGTYFESAMLQLAFQYLKHGKEAFARAAKIADDAKRKAAEQEASRLVAWGHQCRDRKRMAAMREGAKVYPGLPIGAAMLDTHRHLLGVANGVVDLRTGELKPDARDDFVTLRSPYAYKPQAKAPRWQQFIREVSGLQDGTRRPSLERYHQTRAGYFISGEVREQKFFNDTGDGSNGKNMTLDQLGHILGPMAYEMPQGAFEKTWARDSNGPTPTLHGLMHKRLAVAAEWPKGRQVDMVMLLRVTGNESSTARDVHGKNMTAPITAKIVFPSNDPLETGGGASAAFKGRAHVVPYSKRWNRPDEVDPDPALPLGDKTLKHTLRAESEGILAWAVQGAVMYYRDGLTLPEEVAAATRSYIHQQNPFIDWFASLTVLSPHFDRATAPNLDQVHRHYADHCTAAGQTPIKDKALALLLKGKGVPKGEYGQGAGRTRYGLRLP